MISILLKMPTRLAGDILDHFGSRARMVDLGDGNMEVHLFATEEAIRYFALQYGANGCEVLRPESLREQIKEDILFLAKQYQVSFHS